MPHAVPHIDAPLWAWLAFFGLVFVLLALDLFVFHRHSHRVEPREAAGWSVFWIALALLFNGLVFHFYGHDKGAEFLTGYLVEKSLSVDNLFVFLVIFSFFRVPAEFQHRVLFWGIIGALVMRGLMIWLGVELVSRFEWILYVFGAFLIFTAVKLALHDGEGVHPEKNLLVRMFRRMYPVTKRYHGDRFFFRRRGRLIATPLLVTLLVVESTDVMFAVDSIPAIFGITRDPFIIFTSNVWAILGLRALYFLLAAVMDRFWLLKYGLALVLAFIGLKMTVLHYFHADLTVVQSLWVVFGILAGFTALSFLFPRPRKPDTPEDATPRP